MTPDERDAREGPDVVHVLMPNMGYACGGNILTVNGTSQCGISDWDGITCPGCRSFGPNYLRAVSHWMQGHGPHPDREPELLPENVNGVRVGDLVTLHPADRDKPNPCRWKVLELGYRDIGSDQDAYLVEIACDRHQTSAQDWLHGHGPTMCSPTEVVRVVVEHHAVAASEEVALW